MEERLVKTEQLANSITLDIFDQSRPVVGDRWLVVLVARARVPVEERFFKEGGQGNVNIRDIRDALGDQVVFEQRRERNFIDENHKDQEWNVLYANFTETIRDYIAHPDFPMKFIARAYKDYLANKARCDKI